MPTTLIRIETKKISKMLIKMVDMVIANHKLAAETIHNVDREKALKVLENDRKIDAKYYEIEAELEFMITKAPVAKEMRRTLAFLHITRELERVADYAKHIAKFVIKSDKVDSSTIKRIEKVHKEFMKMLAKVSTLIESESNDKALELATMDKNVDTLVQEIRRTLISSIIGKKDEKAIAQRLFTANVINSLERAADHIVIICELVTYIATGSHGSFN